MSMTGPAEEFEFEGKNKIKKLKSILKNRKLQIALFANLRKPGPAKQFIQVLQASKAVHSARRLAPRSKNNNRRCSPFANLLPLSRLAGKHIVSFRAAKARHCVRVCEGEGREEGRGV